MAFFYLWTVLFVKMSADIFTKISTFLPTVKTFESVEMRNVENIFVQSCDPFLRLKGSV